MENHSTAGEDAAHQETAMAVRWILFAAKDGHSKASEPSLEPSDALLEQR